MAPLRSFITGLLCEGPSLTQVFVSRFRPKSSFGPAWSIGEQKACSKSDSRPLPLEEPCP
jgi:hypothetical protein